MHTQKSWRGTQCIGVIFYYQKPLVKVGDLERLVPQENMDILGMAEKIRTNRIGLPLKIKFTERQGRVYVVEPSLCIKRAWISIN